MLVGTADSQPKYKQTVDYTDTWISCLAHTRNMHAYMAGVVVAQHVAGKSNETVIVVGWWRRCRLSFSAHTIAHPKLSHIEIQSNTILNAEHIRTNECGNIRIVLNSGFYLFTFPHDSLYRNRWRALRNVFILCVNVVVVVVVMVGNRSGIEPRLCDRRPGFVVVVVCVLGHVSAAVIHSVYTWSTHDTHTNGIWWCCCAYSKYVHICFSNGDGHIYFVSIWVYRAHCTHQRRRLCDCQSTVYLDSMLWATWMTMTP